MQRQGRSFEPLICLNGSELRKRNIKYLFVARDFVLEDTY